VRCSPWAHWKARKAYVDFLLVLIELFSLGVTAEALRAKTDRKSAISLQRCQFDPKFQQQGVAPTNQCYTYRPKPMPYNFVADSFHAKKLCSRLSPSNRRFYAEKAVLRFGTPFGGLGTTYIDYLRLTAWKAHSGLPISVD